MYTRTVHYTAPKHSTQHFLRGTAEALCGQPTPFRRSTGVAPSTDTRHKTRRSSVKMQLSRASRGVND